MLIVNKLNLDPQWGYRSNPPQGHVRFEFQLDEKSEYFLIEEATKFRTEKGIEDFEHEIIDAVYIHLFTMKRRDFQKLKEGNLPPYIRLVLDPNDQDKMYGIQLKSSNKENKVLVTKLCFFNNNENYLLKSG